MKKKSREKPAIQLEQMLLLQEKMWINMVRYAASRRSLSLQILIGSFGLWEDKSYCDKSVYMNALGISVTVYLCITQMWSYVESFRSVESKNVNSAGRKCGRVLK